MVIGEPKKFTCAACQNLTQLKFSLRFLRENSSNTYLRLMVNITTVNIQQCKSIQTIFFRCEPQIGFQITRALSERSFIAVVTGPVVNI